MQVQQVLHNFLKNAAPSMHKKRAHSLYQAVSAVVESGGRLTITSIGRHLAGESKVKHKIKAVDRLVGNHRLQNERLPLYKGIIALLTGVLIKIDILVDWSPASTRDYQILRASIALNGRSHVLYEEVHLEKNLGNYIVHKHFIEQLAELLPPHIKPTIITDAGFRVPWLKLILSRGWEFEGRVRGNTCFKLFDKNEWITTKEISQMATSRPKYLGKALMGKGQQFYCEIFAYQEPRKKSVHRKNEATGEDKHSDDGAWVLVRSCAKEDKSFENAYTAVKRYKRRMKIEHEFRSIKNDKFGLAFNDTNIRSCKRLEILLLIGALAMLILWLIGQAAELRGLQSHFQVNTTKNRRVLSLIFLGRQVLEHIPSKISSLDMAAALIFSWFSEIHFYKEKNLESVDNTALFVGIP